MSIARSIASLVGFVLVVFYPMLAGASSSQECIGPPSSTAVEACRLTHENDRLAAEINAQLLRIRGEFDDAAERELLDAAHAAWTDYREATCALAQRRAGGMHSISYLRCRDALDLDYLGQLTQLDSGPTSGRCAVNRDRALQAWRQRHSAYYTTDVNMRALLDLLGRGAQAKTVSGYITKIIESMSVMFSDPSHEATLAVLIDQFSTPASAPYGDSLAGSVAAHVRERVMVPALHTPEEVVPLLLDLQTLAAGQGLGGAGQASTPGSALRLAYVHNFRPAVEAALLGEDAQAAYLASVRNWCQSNLDLCDREPLCAAEQPGRSGQ